eukprot:COSAG02_NODE_12242_length_1574_cov_4.128136_2_plen_172_part_01
MYKRKRTTYTPRRRVSRRPNVKAQIVRELRQRSETKSKLLQTSNEGLTAGAAVDLQICDLGQSITQHGRIGNQVRWSGIFCKFAVQSETTTNTQVRFIFYIPKDPTSQLDTSAMTPLTLVDQDQVTTLWDRTVTLNSQGGQGKILTLKQSFFRGLRKGITSQWTSSTSTSVS